MPKNVAENFKSILKFCRSVQKYKKFLENTASSQGSGGEYFGVYYCGTLIEYIF